VANEQASWIESKMLIELTVGLAVVIHQSRGHLVAPGENNAPKAG